MGHRRPGKHQAVLQQALTTGMSSWEMVCCCFPHLSQLRPRVLLPTSIPYSNSLIIFHVLAEMLSVFDYQRFRLGSSCGHEKVTDHPFFSLWSYTLNSTGSHSSEPKRQLQNIHASFTNTTPPISKPFLLSSVSPISCVPMSAWKYQSSH